MTLALPCFINMSLMVLKLNMPPCSSPSADKALNDAKPVATMDFCKQVIYISPIQIPFISTMAPEPKFNTVPEMIPHLMVGLCPGQLLLVLGIQHHVEHPLLLPQTKLVVELPVFGSC